MGAVNQPNIKGTKAQGIDDYRIQNANKTNSKKFPNSSIYIIKIKDTDYYKIGVSQNYHRRIRDISNSMPFVVELLYIKNHDEAYKIETQIHKTIETKYIKSEWFQLSGDDYKSVLNILSNENRKTY